MSLYNMLFGQNGASEALLSMLGLSVNDVGRFRDCYLVRGTERPYGDEEDKDLRIVVYTRNGGGNREEYEEVTSALQAHAEYLCDYDNDHDCTYASYEFRVPPQFKEQAEAMAAAGAEHGATPGERFEQALDAIRKSTP